MQDFSSVEESIRALEKALDISVTVVDNQGIFHSPAGVLIFSPERQSHKKNPVCRIDFCDKCIQHCRYAMIEKSTQLRAPFLETCWKGITELVIPLFRNESLLGMFYAGSWRDESPADNSLSSCFAEEYQKLELFKNPELIKVLSFFSQGILKAVEDFEISTIHQESHADRISFFIRENASRSIGVEDLAAYLKLSRSRTSYLVNSIFSKSFNKMLTEERIGRAKALIVGSDENIAVIAKRIGFSDEFHFNRVFTKFQGMPPGRYRKLKKS